jgi:DNA-directed RNA polymerase specialized sigma24 family protein
MTKQNDKKDPRISLERVRELRERYGTETRDLANSFLDDPFAADDVMQLAFHKLRRMKESELPGDEKLPAFLADMVVRMCLRRTGCGGCIREVFKTRRASVTRIPSTAQPREEQADTEDEEQKAG